MYSSLFRFMFGGTMYCTRQKHTVIKYKYISGSQNRYSLYFPSSSTLFLNYFSHAKHVAWWLQNFVMLYFSIIITNPAFTDRICWIRPIWKEQGSIAQVNENIGTSQHLKILRKQIQMWFWSIEAGCINLIICNCLADFTRGAEDSFQWWLL